MGVPLGLLYPKYMQFRNRFKYRGRSAYARVLLIALFGLLFWGAIFSVFYKVLGYFNSIEVLGVFLASKLLSMVMLVFFSILMFSNIITAISSFFMSEELQLIIAAPFDNDALFYSKMLETIVNSSWMVLLFSMPVYLSYGIIYDQSMLYYLTAVLTIIPFVIISGTIGIGMAIWLVTVFPARRLKDILFLLTLILVIGLYMMFRFIKPERLVDPDAFFTVVDYLASMETPTSAFLPSQWATDILSALLFDNVGGFYFNLGLLWSTALALTVLLNWVFCRLFFDAWSKSQEARTARATRNSLFNRVLSGILRPFSAPVRAIVDKDIRTFFRDTAQWSQLLILSAIIVIYLYNFSVLPVDKSPIPTQQLQNLFAFINLGLAGFVIAAVAVRFGYPAVSLEGESFWIIKTSPLSLKRFLWCKFWINFIVMAVLAEVLIVCSNYLLDVEGFMMALSTATVFLMAFGLTSLSIGFGACYPRFRFENVAQIPMGFGGLMYMIMSVLFIGTVVVLEAWPVHLILTSNFSGQSLTQLQLVEIAASFLIVLLLSVAAFILPMKIGIRRLLQMEQF